MISLKISEDWKKRFVQEMYANDDCYDAFVKDDIVRAYYFGFLSKMFAKKCRLMDSKQENQMNNSLQ